jgi:predicted nucleic acid-binding protein
MNILNEIEDQFNPIVIALNFKIDALISTLDKEQLEKYQNTINKKKEEVKSKLSESLTDDQLLSILNQLE